MKTITAVAILQLLLLVAGSEVPGERKRVVCFYMGLITNTTLYPEDIDGSICTHLLYFQRGINYTTEEISDQPVEPDLRAGGEDYVPRLAKLKAVNPDLKLILHVADPDYNRILQNASMKSNIIRNGIKWLNESGFDGLNFPIYKLPSEKEQVADFFCDLKNELDKHGYILTASFMENTFPGPAKGYVDLVDKMARCCDHVVLRAMTSSHETHRIAPLSLIKSNLIKYFERGLPANKAVIVVPAMGVIFRLEDPRDTGMGVKVSGPGHDDADSGVGFLLRYKEVLKRINNSSLEWTFRRDNETGEPYAFTTSGLWTSYEDRISMEFKARYVLEKGLGGIAINLIEGEDVGNEGEEGRLPLTRAVHDVFTQTLSAGNAQ